MAWNRQNEKKVEEKGRGRQRNVRRNGLVAGAVVVLGAAVAAWWMWPTQEDSEGAASTQKGLIKEVTPAKMSAAAAKSKSRRALDPNSYAAKLLSGKAFTNEFGYVLNRPVSPNAKTNYMDIIENQYLRKHFKKDLDYNLANFLATEPGEDILGDLPPLV